MSKFVKRLVPPKIIWVLFPYNLTNVEIIWREWGRREGEVTCCFLMQWGKQPQQVRRKGLQFGRAPWSSASFSSNIKIWSIMQKSKYAKSDDINQHLPGETHNSQGRHQSSNSKRLHSAQAFLRMDQRFPSIWKHCLTSWLQQSNHLQQSTTQSVYSCSIILERWLRMIHGNHKQNID